MDTVNLMMMRAYVALTAPRPRDERGDVPGWVMITVMTAGLVIVSWGLARNQIGDLLQSAFNSVKSGP